ncbi:hypothetical protein M404DRAFT_1002122 [Pisolithus tinctorius Marx 270]|uniref:PEX14-like helix-turn-helix domain-containing protein n=1 Tax=Pisolithus tinctorius Marx 270 TaxID=870435 RepID=A0A0C3JYQ0_PISTI|nr:hypothetical protein M404DRAFT_1002122 [Pisolithus tinctorius Marx 270]
MLTTLTNVYQHGLIQILAHSSTQSTSEEERSELALKTQLFYFNRCAPFLFTTALHICGTSYS